MAASDVIPQDGGHGNVKLHPYLITLVRWCVSCLWSTATVFVHRLLAAPLPLPPITAGSKSVPRTRAAGSEHLHPEPRVECVVLHSPPPPAAPTVDLVFVHGLYGSLGNTWRQGEWRTKYKLDPTKVPLKSHPTQPCACTPHTHHDTDVNETQANESNLTEIQLNEDNFNDDVTFNHINGCFKNILPKENSLITEQFYNNTLMDVDNLQTQANFVTDLFKNECDTNCESTFKCNDKCTDVNCKCKLNESAFMLNECSCKSDVTSKCEVGCGCVCDECYSHCWPRDWIREDFPDARVISVNYTSDPYLWKPLWVKGHKRLRLHERAEQMICQLVALGVGRRPLVWVGHSKGGLFIKQIYCEAYDAYLKINKSVAKQPPRTNNNNREDQSDREFNNNNHIIVDNKLNFYNNNTNREQTNHILNNFILEHTNEGCTGNDETTLRNIDEMNEIRNNNNSGNNSPNNVRHNEKATEIYGCTENDDVCDDRQARRRDDEELGSHEQMDAARTSSDVDSEDLSSNNEEDSALARRAALWRASRGFMFYSVPHRGSPLAHIKTPITTRSIELLEIAKDCPLVVELQARWLAASGAGRARVVSLVETSRTLMSLLYLRIVAPDSADAGVGSLHGVPLDHRQICKPASRRCPLYTELTHLVRRALQPCRCR